MIQGEDLLKQIPSAFHILGVEPQELDRVWSLIQGFDSIFVDDRMKSKQVYLEQFLRKNTVVFETEGGIVILTGIDPGLKATFHPVFWDHKLSSRLDDLQDLIVWVFVWFNLERLETMVAPYARAAMRFLEKRLGFHYEGTLRSYVRKNGKPMGMKVYSILREEVL